MKATTTVASTSLRKESLPSDGGLKTTAEYQLVQAYRSVPRKLQQRLIEFANGLVEDKDAAVVAARIVRREEGLPVTFSTNPRDPEFFQGSTIEHRLAVLRQQNPAKYDAIGVLLLATLRDEFFTIGPSPRLTRTDTDQRPPEKGGAR